MRRHSSVLHLDLDAFYAAVEQRDKPSLRGKPVVVGGVGPRGVVSTASYEARVFGIRSAMSAAEARARCPQAAFLSGRFPVYREASKAVMQVLFDASPLVEPLSLDEAFVDLAAAPGFDPDATADVARRIRARVPEVTGGLTASVGLGSSKLMAKIASEENKPDGLCIVPPGAELDFLAPRPIRDIPGVGPVTAARLAQFGLRTIAHVRSLEATELADLVGGAGGRSLYRLVRAIDDRDVASHRDTKSISVEDTFATDVTTDRELEAIADRQARQVARRLADAGLSARTVTVKYRYGDFETHTRSATMAGPTDDPALLSRTARRLLRPIETRRGLRLLGVGVSGLADWVQESLSFDDDEEEELELLPAPEPARESAPRRWRPGVDIEHTEWGPGWVWGSGKGRVTVRFETRDTPPGPVRTFDVDDPDLTVLEVRAPSDTVER